MLAKLIVHAPTREAAIARMRRALQELVIEGVETSCEFHLRMMDDPEYQRSAVDIQWLEAKLPELLGAAPPEETIRAAAVGAVLLAERDREGRVRQVANGGARTSMGAAGSDAPNELRGWSRLAREESLRRR
jgi:acetyl-CoA carboxylase biotin carboxylase subunit